MFLGEDYLLSGSTAFKLYEEVSQLPILDPHNHADSHRIVEKLSWGAWKVCPGTEAA